MIFDTREHLEDYRGISAGLDRAIDFLQSRSWEGLEEGRMELDGQRVYAQVMSVEHRQADLAWESHREYVDVQVSLTGTERIRCWPVHRLEGWSEYTGDIRFSQSRETGIPLHMARDCFAVFFPWDAHRPNEGEGKGRKLVIKVKWDKAPFFRETEKEDAGWEDPRKG
ncbi:MAG: YhcH/YjgK/YiaL family protein [Candidatus Limiplasma sp.]|nr:YhcH/YjgK/YiaL family protein [Candidatus Limiplasma sp.]